VYLLDQDDDFIREDEEIVITPSSDSQEVPLNYQNILNQQEESVEKPLKRISRISNLK